MCTKNWRNAIFMANGVEMIRQLFEGTWSGGKIQFWYNYVTKTIESAWPK